MSGQQKQLDDKKESDKQTFSGENEASGDISSSEKKRSDDKKTPEEGKVCSDRRMSGNRKMSGENKKSRLRRLSSTFKKLLVRRDSGYDSEGQQQTQQMEDDTPPRSRSISSTSERLQCQEEVDEEATADSSDGGEATDDESLETGQLSNKERHLINIRFALLLEQHRNFQAVLVADINEIKELERREAEEQLRQLEESDEVEEPDLFPRRRRKASSRWSGSEDSDYFDGALEERRQRRLDSNWRKQWSLRTSNAMYSGYRNNLDYCY